MLVHGIVEQDVQFVEHTYHLIVENGQNKGKISTLILEPSLGKMVCVFSCVCMHTCAFVCVCGPGTMQVLAVFGNEENQD